MAKKKLTLTIDEDVLGEAKRLAVAEGRSLSSLVEDYLKSLAFESWIDSLAKELGLDLSQATGPDEVPRTRPRGGDAAKTVREVRRRRIG